MFIPDPLYREVCRLLGPPGHIRPRRDPVLRLDLRVRPPAPLPPTEPLPLLTPTLAIPLTGRGGRLRRAPRALRAPRREAGRGGLLTVWVVVFVVALVAIGGGQLLEGAAGVRDDVCAQRPSLCAPTPSPVPAP